MERLYDKKPARYARLGWHGSVNQQVLGIPHDRDVPLDQVGAHVDVDPRIGVRVGEGEEEGEEGEAQRAADYTAAAQQHTDLKLLFSEKHAEGYHFLRRADAAMQDVADAR